MQKKQQHLGRYEVAGELRRSTSGIIHQARDPELDRDVAIKTLVVPLDAEPAEAERRRERFLAEAECAGRLQHPGIVVVYETDQDSEPESPFMAMEFVAGPSLEQLIAGEGALNADWVLGTAETLAEALQAAHADDIFHGDLKPSNILIRESDGAPKIADFGAPRTQLDLRNLTDDDGGARSSYLAPEVIQGAAADARNDLFSLALVIYEALCGQHAYEGHDFVSSCGAILDKAPIPIRQRVSDIAPSVEAFLMRALSYEPADRFPDAGAFAAALAGARVAQQHYVAPASPGIPAETTVEPCPADADSVLELHDPMLPPGGDTSPEELDDEAPEPRETETPIVPTDTQDLAGGLPVADYKPLELAIGIPEPDPEPDPAGTDDTGFAFDVLEDDAEAAPSAAAEQTEAVAPTGVLDEPTDTPAEPVHSPAPDRGRTRPAPRVVAAAGAQPEAPEGSRRWVVVVLALAFLVVVGIIAMALSGGAGDDTTTTAQVPRTTPAPFPDSPAGLQVRDGSVTATAEPTPEIEATPVEPPAPKAAAPKPRKTAAPVKTRPAPKQPAAPAPAEPVVAPVEAAPGAVTAPPPAVPTHSFLDVAVTSSIKAGTLILLVDGQPVSTHELTTESGTWARAVQKVKRQVKQEFTARLEISPGRHTLTARIIREKRSKVLEESVQVDLEAGASATIAIDAGKTLGRKLSIDVVE